MSEVIMDVEMADAVPELAQAPLPKAKLDDLALLVADSDDVIRSASEILTAYSTTHRLWQILRIEDKSINRKWGTYAGLSRIALGGKGFKCMKSKKDPTLKWLLIDTIDPVGEHNLTVSPVEFLDIQNEYEASVKSSKKRKKKDDSAAIDVVVKKRTYLEACIVVLREKGVVSRPSLASFVSVLQGAENDKKLSSNIKTALEKGIRENVIVKVSASFKLNPAWVKSERDKAKKAKIAKEAPVKFPIEDRLLPAYDKKHRTKDKDKKLPLPVGAPIGDMDKPWMNDCIAIHALFSDEAFVGRVGFSYDLLNRALEMGPKFPAFLTTLMVKSLKLLAGDAGGDEGGDEKEKKIDRRYDIFEDFVDLICPLTWPKCVVLFFEQQGLYSEKRIARERQENCLQGQQEDFDLFSKESEKIIGKLKKDEPGALSPLERAQLLRMLADELSAKYMLSVYEERSQAAEEAAKKIRKAEAEVKKIAKDNEQMKAEWVREEEEEAAKITPKKRKKRDGGEREQLISTMEKAEKSSTLAVEEAEEDYEDLISTEVNRHPSLGADKNGSEYFHFPSLPGKLFVKSKSGKKWSVFSKMSEYDAIVAALDERGINELALKGKLRGRAYMTDDVLDEKKQLEIERLNKRIERLQEDQKRMEEHVLKQGRRSTRVVEEGSKTTGPSELEVLIAKRDGVGSDVDLYLDPEVAQLKETGVLVSLAEDLELQGPIDVYQKIPKYPKHGVGSAPGDHKVLPFHEATNPATFLAREILAFEASVTAFQPLSDRTRSSKFRDDLKAIADDEYVTIKEKLKALRAPLKTIEARVYALTGGAFIDQQFDIDSSIVFDAQGGDGSDSDGGDEEDDVDLEDIEDDFFMNDILTPQLKNLSSALHRTRRKEWMAELGNDTTVAGLATIFYGLMKEAVSKIEELEEAKIEFNRDIEKLQTLNGLQSQPANVQKKKAAALKNAVKEAKAVVKGNPMVYMPVTPSRTFFWAQIQDFPWWPVVAFIVEDEHWRELLKKNGLSVVSFLAENEMHLVNIRDMRPLFDEEGIMDIPERPKPPLKGTAKMTFNEAVRIAQKLDYGLQFESNKHGLSSLKSLDMLTAEVKNTESGGSKGGGGSPVKGRVSPMVNGKGRVSP